MLPLSSEERVCGRSEEFSTVSIGDFITVFYNFRDPHPAHAHLRDYCSLSSDVPNLLLKLFNRPSGDFSEPKRIRYRFADSKGESLRAQLGAWRVGSLLLSFTTRIGPLTPSGSECKSNNCTVAATDGRSSLPNGMPSRRGRRLLRRTCQATGSLVHAGGRNEWRVAANPAVGGQVIYGAQRQARGGDLAPKKGGTELGWDWVRDVGALQFGRLDIRETAVCGQKVDEAGG